MNKIDISFFQTLTPSTNLIENIKNEALAISKEYGKGLSLRIDIKNVKNKEYDIYLEKVKIENEVLSKNIIELLKQTEEKFSFKIDVINNKENKNCNIFVEKKVKID